MDAIGELPTTEELEKLAERMLRENESEDDLMMAVGAISELIALRHAIDLVLVTCTDLDAVAYLRDMREKTKQ